ncbi:leucine-rich PPR motif-containing protein, mitochondrial-like, partial [Xylocopa sonorina]|uniref:leucine-rich PPR motif-containing protein, mitochondrial-like n=1 Tax=Xylocopa sonorina TaxID=1818115 RepID=UPI00403A8304
MISIRRYKTLLKTTITYKTILANNFIVFIPALHKNNIAHCYCTMKAPIIDLRIKNIRKLSGNNDTSSDEDFYNKLMLLNKSFNNKQVKLDVLESIIDDLESKNYNISEELSVMLLSCCGSMLYDKPLKVRLELIDRIVNFLKRNEYPLTIDHYHALLKAYIDNDHAIDPQKFLESITITPEYETYCLLLQVPSTNNCAFADTITLKLEQNILPISKTICDALAYAYALNGNADGVTKTMKLMEKENLNEIPEMKTYLMYSYARNGQITALTNSLKDATLSVQHITKIVKYLSLSGNGMYIPNILKHIQPLTTEKDIISTIIQLVHAGCILDAQTIVTYVPIDKECEDIRRTLALCFLKSISKLNIDQNIMLQVMTNLIKVELNFDILQEAIKLILGENNVDLAIQLLYRAKAVGITVNLHYFWPILSYVQDQTHKPDLYTLIKHMVELNIEPDFITFMNYILPFINLSKPIITIIKMAALGVAPAYTVEPIVRFLLVKGRLEESIEVCSWFKKKVDCQPILDSLYSNYRQSNDIRFCAHFLYELTYNGHGFTASFIKKMIKESNFQTCDTQPLISFLIIAKQKSAVISTADATSISNIISNMNFIEPVKSSILNHISDITADSHKENYNTGEFVHPQFMNAYQLNQYYELLRSRKRNLRGTLRKLLLIACHINDEKLVSKLVVEMKENNFEWTFGMRCNLFDFYVKNKMNEEAWSELEEIQFQFQIERMDNFKILRFAMLLITENRVKDALYIINKCELVNHKPDVHTQVNRLIFSLMQNNHLEYVEEMIDVLDKRGYYNLPIHKFRHLILTQIVKGNIKKAVASFTDCANKLKKTPAKQEILVELMKLPSNSPSKYYLLQKVYELIINIHNKDIANINVAIAYGLCNRISELQYLLKEKNIKEQLMLDQFRYLKDSDIITVTLAILEATDSSSTVNLNSIYTAALAACDKQNDYIHAVELQNKMISKNIKPSKSFQKAFTKLLETHKIPICPKVEK